jgi:glutaredoxin
VELYTTAACHLCELAEQLLEASPLRQQVVLEKVEISDSDTLMERYGIRIPVLRRENGQELGWPFDAELLEAFLANG